LKDPDVISTGMKQLRPLPATVMDVLRAIEL